MSTKKDIAYPPGGFLMWLILSTELLTIFLFLVFFIIDQKNHVEVFKNSLELNNIYLALFNTFVLMLSGYLITKVETLNHQINTQMLFGSFFLGLVFVLIKLFEYKVKMDNGLFFDLNLFFTYYWFLTLFHLLHVVIALSLFGYILLRSKNKNIKSPDTIKSIEIFWHLCDLIWIIILPFLYGFNQGIYSIYLTLILFILKAFIIFRSFIKINQSHPLWQVISMAFVVLFFILIYVSQKIYF